MCVYNFYFLSESRFMRPEGPWQRLLVAEGWEGLQEEVPKGAGLEVAVERGGRRSSGGIFGGHVDRVPGVVWKG